MMIVVEGVDMDVWIIVLMVVMVHVLVHVHWGAKEAVVGDVRVLVIRGVLDKLMHEFYKNNGYGKRINV